MYWETSLSRSAQEQGRCAAFSTAWLKSHRRSRRGSHDADPFEFKYLSQREDSDFGSYDKLVKRNEFVS
jgi:hypothetical protein